MVRSKLSMFLALTALLGLRAAVPGPVAAHTGPPPTCAYRDVLTPYHSYADWRRTLVDTIYMVPKSYAPGDLVSTGVAGGGHLRSLVVADLRPMFAAARSAGASLAVVSSYRSFATQVSTFNYWVSVSGYKAALLASARPGHSEHQLGTALDVTTYAGRAPWTYTDWGTTRAGTWMRNNSWRYGFVMSYPKGKSAVTCYKYEPWHFRYFGRTVALRIHESGLTSREYLWRLAP